VHLNSLLLRQRTPLYQVLIARRSIYSLTCKGALGFTSQQLGISRAISSDMALAGLFPEAKNALWSVHWGTNYD